MTALGRGRAAALTMALALSTWLGIATADASSRAVKEGLDNQQNTVSIVSGTPAGTYLQIAYDLSAVLDNPQGLRVLPMLGKGGAQNIRDVLSLKGIDMGIAQTTDLARIKAAQRDLEGKPVNFSDIGGGTQFVARELFEKSGVRVREVNMGQADAIEKMKSGEVAATIYVAGKPGPAFTRAPRDLGFHFLPVPYGRAFEESYYPAVLGAADYPGL